jgi:hypothetical protein
VRRASLLVLIAVATAGCNGGSAASNGAGPCGNPYQPSGAGTRWQYRTSSATGTFASADTVTSASASGFAITSRSPGGARVVHYRCGSAGIVALDAAGVAGTAVIEGAHHTFSTTAISGVTLPPSPAGKTWRQTVRVRGTALVDGTAEKLLGSVATTFTAAAHNTSVTVPAGTFQALAVSERTRFDVTVTVRGVSVPVRTVVSTTAYLAPGAGLVRSVSVGNLLGARLGSQTVLVGMHSN